VWPDLRPNSGYSPIETPSPEMAGEENKNGSPRLKVRRLSVASKRVLKPPPSTQFLFRRIRRTTRPDRQGISAELRRSLQQHPEQDIAGNQIRVAAFDRSLSQRMDRSSSDDLGLSAVNQ
jgi:hypothetical protein